MRRKNSSKKALLFLVLLGVFGFVSVTFVKNLKVDVESLAYAESASETCQSCNQNIQEDVKTDNKGYMIYEFSEDQVVDVTKESKEVLGAGAGSMCDPAVNRVDLVRRICSTNSIGVLHEVPKEGEKTSSGGGRVDTKKINGFRLTKVTYPLAFWLGKYFMANSNRQITKVDSAYSSNGQQIDANYQLKTLAPYQSEELEAALPTTERKPFEVTGKLNLPDVDEVSVPATDGKYTVDNHPTDPKCGCPRDVSTSDYNVGDSNMVSSYQGTDGDIGGYLRQQIPGGDNYAYGSGDTCIAASEYEDVSLGLWTACSANPIMSFVKGIFRTFGMFSTDKWDYCDEDGHEVCTTNEEGEQECTTDRDSCVDPRSLVVMMTPIFGEVYKCTDGICANSFLTYAYTGTLSPQQASTKVESSPSLEQTLMYFLATPCEADIEFDDGRVERDVPVKCMWDASPTLFNYRLQAKDKAPKQEDFPQTYEEYWKGVEVAIADSAIKYGL